MDREVYPNTLVDGRGSDSKKKKTLVLDYRELGGYVKCCTGVDSIDACTGTLRKLRQMTVHNSCGSKACLPAIAWWEEW